MNDSTQLLADHAKSQYAPISDLNDIKQEWFFLEINERLRISILINVTDDMTDEQKENFARYQYKRMTFQDVTAGKA